MATFFGEIVESSSRAFLDDDEDDYDENSTTSSENKCEFAVSWQTETAAKPGYDVFLVIMGSVAKAFAERFLLNGVPATGTIKRSQLSSDDKKPIRKLGEGKLYMLPSGILACVVTDVLDTEAVPFVDSITEMLKSASSQVLILTSVPLNQYRSSVPLPVETEGFLRSLTTADPPPVQLAVSCPSLEIPNLIVGVPAAVLTWCQREKLRCRLVICYSEESCGMIDSRTLAPFMPLLKCPPLSHLPHTSGEKLSQLPVAHEVSGNMYI